MTLAASLVSLFCALVGTYHAESLGRRTVLVYGTLLCTVMLAVAMGCSAASGAHAGATTTSGEGPTDKAASRAAIAFLLLFSGAFSWAYTALQPIYPGEVLSTELRAAGMGCVVLAANAGMLMSQFAIPVALKKIGYWTYLPFVIWTVIEAALWYFLAVETKGHTLEELDAVFESPNPVKASLRRTANKNVA